MSMITKLISKRLFGSNERMENCTGSRSRSTSNTRPPTRKASEAAAARISSIARRHGTKKEAETAKKLKIKKQKETAKQKAVAKKSKEHAETKKRYDQKKLLDQKLKEQILKHEIA